MNPFDDESGTFIVLVNDEGQYSLWPTFKSVPAGWKTEGPSGTKAECLKWVDEHWRDMRPNSLIQQMGS